MAPKSPLLLQWMQKAEEDWEAAMLLSPLPTQASTTCFHCQQCIEKLLKAALLSHGAEIPKIHDLGSLSLRLSQVDSSWQWDPDVLELLTTAAVASRYPGYAVGAAEVS
jgi:HEPN domain-containing protein